MLEIRTNPLQTAEWLGLIEAEYLAGFVQAGGASAKFAIADEATHGALQQALQTLATQHGMVTAQLSSATTKLHMMQELFFALVDALPWDSLMQRYLEQVFARNEYSWPTPGEKMGTNQLAEAFGIAPILMARNRDQWLSRDLWDDPSLARDFRTAAIGLSLARFNPGISSLADQMELRWMRGEKLSPAALREADIAAHIGRTNARAMLISLCHFLRKAGVPGLLLSLDLRPAIRRTSAGLHYAPSALMDLYEVLRELIDDLEHLPGLFLLGIADQALIVGDRKRTLDTYKALEMRIWPDVRPGDRQNPLAPLVMVAS
jgi:hypothetical protein